MSQPATYSLRPDGASPERYLGAVARFADQVLATGQALGPMVDAYRSFVEASGREESRSRSEYLVEALLLGVLWTARGRDATSPGARTDLVALLVRERRRTGTRRRDGTTAGLLSPHAGGWREERTPTLADVRRLLEWLYASGEYDDEVERLTGWDLFLSAEPALAESRLGEIAAFAGWFATASASALGKYAERVDTFVEGELRAREPREDTVQCSRRRTEYHLNMVGAELLNRAWRAAFLACPRHVVVLPGCARRHSGADCRARRSSTELCCAHCTVGCVVSAATRTATRWGSEALAVVHGSDFSRFLRSPALRGGDVGIVGVACVPGLVGAGWRARATGLPAQCVLLEASGCGHWRESPVPTALDLGELERVLRLDDPDTRVAVTPRVA
jgi:uncharacterized protein